MFGDVTRRVGDVLEIPEYQKNGIDTRGFYAVTKVETEYDGGIRQSVTCRKIYDRNVIDEMTIAPEYIIDEVNATDTIEEGRGLWREER
jgi:hypothetical protein